ncbi:MAG: preprotein translocase subunit SecG [Chthoniobacter sp.]|jgi:preprotein translocase subunit SecG|nr:preprotein translocase subunit SecG [Chthoniobacter sp.]
MAILINFLLTIFVIDSLLLIFIVLMQRPKSEGLGAAFGGGMTDNLFGAQTTNVLAGFTRYLAGIFFGLALLLSVLYARQSQTKSSIQQELIRGAKPVAIPATSPAMSAAPATAIMSETPVPSSTPESTLQQTVAPAPSMAAKAAASAKPTHAVATPRKK